MICYNIRLHWLYDYNIIRIKDICIYIDIDISYIEHQTINMHNSKNISKCIKLKLSPWINDKIKIHSQHVENWTILSAIDSMTLKIFHMAYVVITTTIFLGFWMLNV